MEESSLAVSRLALFPAEFVILQLIYEMSNESERWGGMSVMKGGSAMIKRVVECGENEDNRGENGNNMQEAK